MKKLALISIVLTTLAFVVPLDLAFARGGRGGGRGRAAARRTSDKERKKQRERDTAEDQDSCREIDRR